MKNYETISSAGFGKIVLIFNIMTCTYSWSLANSVRTFSLAPRTIGALNPIAAHLALIIIPMSGLTRLILRNSRRTSFDKGGESGFSPLLRFIVM